MGGIAYRGVRGTLSIFKCTIHIPCGEEAKKLVKLLVYYQQMMAIVSMFFSLSSTTVIFSNSNMCCKYSLFYKKTGS